MNRKSYLYSVILHAGVLLFLALDISAWWGNKRVLSEPVPLIIDLTKVEISSKTNLPPEVKKKAKAEVSKPVEVKAKPAPVVKETKPVATVKPVTRPSPVKQEDIKPIPQNIPKEAVPVVQEKVVEKTLDASQNTPAGGDLRSLLASVDKVKKTPTRTSSFSDTVTETGQEVNQGIKGGTGGSLNQVLSVSETDFIASKLRSCWNVDAGVEGVEDILIEVKAIVNKDGRVRDVKVTNMKSGNPFFRSLAESAVRAVYICDNQGVDSPFMILAEKYPERYNDWKELNLRFNPIDKGVY